MSKFAPAFRIVMFKYSTDFLVIILVTAHAYTHRDLKRKSGPGLS